MLRESSTVARWIQAAFDPWHLHQEIRAPRLLFTGEHTVVMAACAQSHHGGIKKRKRKERNRPCRTLGFTCDRHSTAACGPPITGVACDGVGQGAGQRKDVVMAKQNGQWRWPSKIAHACWTGKITALSRSTTGIGGRDPPCRTCLTLTLTSPIARGRQPNPNTRAQTRLRGSRPNYAAFDPTAAA